MNKRQIESLRARDWVRCNCECCEGKIFQVKSIDRRSFTADISETLSIFLLAAEVLRVPPEEVILLKLKDKQL